MHMLLPVSVNQTLLRRRTQVGKSDLKAPNQGLDCGFCCWVAWPRLAEKECFCADQMLQMKTTNASDGNH